MKKIILLVLFALLLPAVADAQEKNLYDINDDILFLIETYAACAGPDSACTQEDALAIQERAQESMRDLAGLLKSVNRSRVMLTADQVRSLSMRAGVVSDQLAYIETGDEACNTAIYFFNRLLYTLYGLVLYLNPIVVIIAIGYGGLDEVIRELIYLLISVPWLLLKSLVYSPACLFWWL
ncbi:MAG: hypothetical protein JW832_15320 [Deltaproteobacteria bacterium]|nr:hypothetical protein [Deltaproteobacteria bacterium]